MIISAYTVETDTVGFAVCWWPVTSKKKALQMAEAKSINHIFDPAYPNAFWVVSGSKSICKYFRGKRYPADQTI